jgi:hypothetical protein
LWMVENIKNTKLEMNQFILHTERHQTTMML